MYKKGPLGCNFLVIAILLSVMFTLPLVVVYSLNPKNAMLLSLLEKTGLQKLLAINNKGGEKAVEYIQIEFNSGYGLPKNTIEAINQRIAKNKEMSPSEIDQKEKSLKIELSRKYRDTKNELAKGISGRESEALAKFEQGNYSLAKELFAEELTQKRKPDLAAYHLGNIKSLELDFLRAAFYYNQAVIRFPGNINYLRAAGDAWKELGKLDDARDYYHRAFTTCRLKLGEQHQDTIEIRNLMEEVKAKRPPSEADIYNKLANTP